jgi:hypothetical protein
MRHERAALMPGRLVYSCSPRVCHHPDAEIRGVLLDARSRRSARIQMAQAMHTCCHRMTGLFRAPPNAMGFLRARDS